MLVYLGVPTNHRALVDTLAITTPKDEQAVVPVSNDFFDLRPTKMKDKSIVFI